MSDHRETARTGPYASVYRYVRRRSRTREDAEDLTQTVFAETLAGLEQGTDDAHPTLALLYTVAKRRLIDEHRHRRQEPAQVISLDAVRVEQTPPADYGVDVAQVLTRAISALPDNQRRVVVLKLFEGRRFAEIATQLGISDQACRTRLARALRTLRRQLEEEGITP